MKKNKKTIGIIGCGNMGEAIIAQSAKRKTRNFIISDKDKLKEAFVFRYYKKYGVKIAGDIANLVKRSNVVIIAVKPQDIDIVIQEISKGIKSGNKRGILIISIAAGIETRYIENKIYGKIKVVRAMPNMPGVIGEGITVLTKGYYATNVDLRLAREIFGALGTTIEVRKEGLIDVVTAISGSGPAYIFFIINAILIAARGLSLDEKSANQLIYHTIVGAMNLYKKSQFNADKLIKQVASKGGTTEAALNVFKTKKLNKIIWDGIFAAHKKARQLSRSIASG